MKNYYRVILGENSAHVSACFAEGFIGADFEIPHDLTTNLTDGWRAFNAKCRPIFLTKHPGKTKIGAGLACSFLWSVAKGIRKGDIVLCPDGADTYRIGEVISDYFYAPGVVLPHRRKVNWLTQTINRADMSKSLKRSIGSIGTVSKISGHADEIEKLIGGSTAPTLIPTDEAVEDSIAFTLEKRLEDFLVLNWAQTDLGKEYDIYEEDGEKVGQQYPTDTGQMDLLAIRKDRSELLVVELKKGRASDVVVGQVLRYMGYALQELAEPNQSVRGVIIALEDD
jgi:restriction system protein